MVVVFDDVKWRLVQADGNSEAVAAAVMKIVIEGEVEWLLKEISCEYENENIIW